jgi:hypothetical protein
MVSPKVFMDVPLSQRLKTTPLATVAHQLSLFGQPEVVMTLARIACFETEGFQTRELDGEPLAARSRRSSPIDNLGSTSVTFPPL